MPKGPIVFFVLCIVGILGLYFGIPMVREVRHRGASDAAMLKGEIKGRCDEWVGYFPLMSQRMKNAMAESGYRFKCEDDGAKYAERMEALKNGDIDFAVATNDSYIVNAAKRGFPGVITTVIDESFGGDSMLAWGDVIPNLNAIKGRTDIKIGYTCDSPSHHLAKAAAHHFDIPELIDKKLVVCTDGSKEALQKLQKKEIQVAIMWEPDVSRGLAKTGVIKLLGTESTVRLIVDILLFKSTFSEKNPETVKTFQENYFKVLKFYMDNPSILEQEVMASINAKAAVEDRLTIDQVRSMLKGVRWVNLTENAEKWFGITTLAGTRGEHWLTDSIDSTAEILINSKDFPSNPLPEQDASRITQKKFIADLYEKMTIGFTVAGAGKNVSSDSLTTKFSPLSEAGWQNLKEVGTMKVEHINFEMGTSELSSEDKEKFAAITERIKHYPTFWLLIKGHTSAIGDPKELLELSQERADSVQRFLSITYGIDENRMRAVGLGSSKPIPCASSKCRFVLPRVEIVMMSEVY
ncbi:MAG: phosphate ABC transporter substrate-binding/OmpA family protein [bacterium]|nr:phosphate ABC transporter substrate-binding/OmpA family protein [bacterium]